LLAMPSMDAIAMKREANVQAKMAKSKIGMNWESKAPTFYYKTLQAKRATRPVVSAEEAAARVLREERRIFCTAARQIFHKADSDGSRSLDYTELKKFLLIADPDNLAEVLDTDKSGSVSMEEWLAFVTTVYDKAGGEPAFQLLEAVIHSLFLSSAIISVADRLFERFDRDNSGELDYAEVAAMFPEAPGQAQETAEPAAGRRGRRRTVLNDEAYGFIQLVDKDRSGTLDAEEWREFLFDGWRQNPAMAMHFCAYLEFVANETYGGTEIE